MSVSSTADSGVARITWGLLTGPRAQRRAELLWIFFGLALLAAAFTAIFALRR